MLSIEDIDDFVLKSSGYITVLGAIATVVGVAFATIKWGVDIFGVVVAVLIAAAGGLVAGVAIGVLVHRRYASRRNAPLGYRVSSTLHTFRYVEKNTFLRGVERVIKAKRDQLYAIDGRFRTDAAEAQVREMKGDAKLHTVSVDSDGYEHYIIFFNKTLIRDQPQEVALHHLLEFQNIEMEPLYSHGTAVWSRKVQIELKLPTEWVEKGSMMLTRERGVGTGRERCVPIEKGCDFRYADGQFNVSINSPRRGYRYCLRWVWTEMYKENVSNVVK